MARIRSVHPGQWSDEDFLECSMAARLLALALRNMVADDHGAFAWKPKTIKVLCFPADDVDVCALLDELLRNQQVIRYSVDGRTYGLIRNFEHWQRPKKPNYHYPVPNGAGTGTANGGNEGGQNDSSTDVISEPVPNQFSTDTELLPNQSTTSSEKVIQKVVVIEGGSSKGKGTLGETEKQTKNLSVEADGRNGIRAPPTFAWPNDFRDQFWNAYPHKIGKRAALTKLDSIRRDDRIGFPKLMLGLAAYVHDKPPDRPWCNPLTWLNQERWDDQPALPITRALTPRELKQTETREILDALREAGERERNEAAERERSGQHDYRIAAHNGH